jgi:hypothetical protein
LEILKSKYLANAKLSAKFFLNIILYWCYLWNENSSERNLFIQWYYFKCQTSFYIKQKRRGREQDSGEKERERVCVCERWSMVEGGGSVSYKMVCWGKCNGWDQGRIKRVRLYKFQRMLIAYVPQSVSFLSRQCLETFCMMTGRIFLTIIFSTT